MNRTRRHRLADILTLTICAVICGADGWAQVADFGRCKLKWLQTFLVLPHGLPSHDTFGRVFAKLDPTAFEACFLRWIADVATASEGRLIAIDGKTIRRSLDAANGRAAVHMVSAWSQANHLVLGQVATDTKSNEITAIPELLKWLDLKGAVVTIDALGCQKKIAAQIVGQGADYIRQLKGNQGGLHDETALLFDQCLRDDGTGIRYTAASNGPSGKGCGSLVRVEARRTLNGQTSVKYRYSISSLDARDSERMLGLIRGHWGIENGLHWSLDLSFREDECRIRQGHAAENYSRRS
jgi:predicted transposase YbfD/YdcC